MTRFFLLGAALLFAACSGPDATTGDDVATVTETTDTFLESLKTSHPVTLSKVAEDIWVHTTNYVVPGQGPIPSNGLVVRDGEDVILVDGAWGELATLSLMETIKAELGQPVTHMVVTHHHPDKGAGVDVAELRDVQVFTHPETPRLAYENGFPVPNTSVSGLREAGSRSRLGAVEIAFPGPGHAVDNLVVYVPKAKLLYGGCMIRGAGTTTLGNTASADLDAWPNSLKWVKATYPDTQTIVPGHGKGAGLSLIDGTLKLLADRDQASEASED